MLAHTYKNKRSSVGNSRLRMLSSFLQDEKLARSTSVVDKMYEDYHNRRRSEKVLRIIDNALNSRENMAIAPKLPPSNSQSMNKLMADKGDMLHNFPSSIQDEQRISKMLIDITNMVKEMQKLENKESTPKIFRDKNKLRKRYDKAVEKYQKEVMENQSQHRMSQISIGIKSIMADTAQDKDILKKRYKKAVTKYRCEIFENRWKKEKENIEFQNQRITDLENIVVNLKLENCTLTTETESLRFQVSHLENHFLEVEELFGNLSTKIEEKFTSYQDRISKAFDKLYECKIKLKKKRKFFGKN